MKPLDIIFAGTPNFAAQHLQVLLNSSHNVIAVYTQPDKPAGRGKKLQAGPVKQLAEQHQIPVYQPKSLRRAETQAELAALQADVMVVVAYGLILPQAVLDAPKYGCLIFCAKGQRGPRRQPIGICSNKGTDPFNVPR